jgi:orotidine-5'-phosphate decarboxylase
MAEHFADRLADAVARCRSPAVVGIDPVLEKLPDELRPADLTVETVAAALERFSMEVVEIAGGRVAAVKINAAFFEACYDRGLGAYYRVVRRAHERGLLVIGDIKRGDIGSTAALYARGHLEPPRYAGIDPACIPDAVTLHGYLGAGCVEPFILAARQAGRGVYVLVRPSDPGADEVHEFGAGPRLYEHMAALVDRWGSASNLVGKCGLSCVGAVVAPKGTASTEALRRRMPRTPWLVPGYGAQGAEAEACRACFLPGGGGAVINASRSVIYAFDEPAYRARHGPDWRACIRAACDEFARDAARMQSGRPHGPAC